MKYLSGYKIVGDYLDKTIIRPNNLKFQFLEQNLLLFN